MADSREKALHKHVRIAPEQWERLERAAQGTPHSPNQILVELAMEALDRRQWPATKVEMRVARAALFTAQSIALDLIAAGREKRGPGNPRLHLDHRARSGRKAAFREHLPHSDRPDRQEPRMSSSTPKHPLSDHSTAKEASVPCAASPDGASMNSTSSSESRPIAATCPPPDGLARSGPVAPDSPQFANAGVSP